MRQLVMRRNQSWKVYEHSEKRWQLSGQLLSLKHVYQVVMLAKVIQVCQLFKQSGFVVFRLFLLGWTPFRPSAFLPEALPLLFLESILFTLEFISFFKFLLLDVFSLVLFDFLPPILLEEERILFPKMIKLVNHFLEHFLTVNCPSTGSELDNAHNKQIILDVLFLNPIECLPKNLVIWKCCLVHDVQDLELVQLAWIHRQGLRIWHIVFPDKLKQCWQVFLSLTSQMLVHLYVCETVLNIERFRFNVM